MNTVREGEIFGKGIQFNAHSRLLARRVHQRNKDKKGVNHFSGDSEKQSVWWKTRKLLLNSPLSKQFPVLYPNYENSSHAWFSNFRNRLQISQSFASSANPSAKREWYLLTSRCSKNAQNVSHSMLPWWQIPYAWSHTRKDNMEIVLSFFPQFILRVSFSHHARIVPAYWFRPDAGMPF